MKEKSIEELNLLIKEQDSDAIYELGKRYFSGNGIEKNFEKAIEYFKLAESMGNIKGKYGIAKCYFYGRGFRQDYEKAYNIFYDLMTKYNDIDSKYYIGLMYYKGYFVKQNYEMAYNIFNEMANNGDNDAKKHIADMYYFGQYVQKDYFKSFEIFKDLYENTNDPYSMVMLADMYYHGHGTTRDYKQARILGELFEETHNDKNTAYILGEIYYYGKDTEINYEKAKIYFEKSLDERYDDAYYHLGLIYQNGGYGVEKDFEKAEKYFFKIEMDMCKFSMYYILALGDNSLGFWTKILSYDKDLMKQLLDKFPQKHPAVTFFNKLKSLKIEQYNRATGILREKINKFYQLKQPYFSIDNVANEEEVDILSEVIIESNNYNSMDDYLKIKLDQENDKRLLYMIGMMIYEGRGCKKDIKEGLSWLNKSAKQNYPYALYQIAEIQYNNNKTLEAIEILNNLLNCEEHDLQKKSKNILGKIYYYGGNGIEKNKQKAFKYFLESDDIITSKEHIGKSYFYGYGVEKNYNKAMEIFNNIKTTSRVALFYLGEMYRLGYGVAKNFEQSYSYYKESANKDYPQAQYHLGQAYLLGEGVEKDVEKALFWLDKASKHEYKYATYTLGILYYYGSSEGFNIQINKKYAIELLEKAIREGSQEAQLELEKIKSNSHYLEEPNGPHNSNVITTYFRHVEESDNKDNN